MPRTIRVELDGGEYEIRELRARLNAKWLKRLEGPLLEAVTVISAAPDVEMTDGEALGRLLASVTEILVGVVDQVVDLLIAYAPELEEQFEGCFTSEAVAAFVEVVQLALPFGDLLKRVRSLRGLTPGPTKPN